MKNLTIEQQKEFEKMIAKINGLHQENEDLVKNHNKELQQLHNVNKNLIKEIDKLKKQNLELIRQNNKLNKKISSYENNFIEDIKFGDIDGYEEYFKHQEELEEVYCE